MGICLISLLNLALAILRTALMFAGRSSGALVNVPKWEWVASLHCNLLLRMRHLMRLFFPCDTTAPRPLWCMNSRRLIARFIWLCAVRSFMQCVVAMWTRSKLMNSLEFVHTYTRACIISMRIKCVNLKCIHFDGQRHMLHCYRA